MACARQLHAKLKVRHPNEIDVELIANNHSLLVRRLPMQHEEGRLLRTRDHGIINVAEDAYRSNKWRFVVAHEVGHFLRHADADNFEACTRG
ncbi:MAG: ImmA/IrrE family metallo-endopeptidase, partial [Polyangiaceae bacterium]